MSLDGLPRDVGGEVHRELDFHLAMVERELVAAGWSEAAAKQEARRRFGNLGVIETECRQLGTQTDVRERRSRYLDAFASDVRFALRQLARTPLFTAIAVFTLALGIGATTAIFSVVQSVVLRPWPWAEPDRVLQVDEVWQGRDGSVAPGNFLAWEKAPGFKALAVEQFSSFNVADAADPERVNGGRVSGRFFDVFGVPPAMGRPIGPSDDAPGHPLVAVLSHELWTRRFAADSTAVGRDLRLDGQSYQVVGVMPESFNPSASAEELWIPLALTPDLRANDDRHYLSGFGRLADGVSIETAQGQVAAIMAHAQETASPGNKDRGVAIYPLADRLVGERARQLWVLLGAVALVLLIACSNVANLLLARGARRSKEIAVRAALGAGGGRIVRQLLTESAVLALLSSAAGLAVAAATIRGLLLVAPAGIPRLTETHLDLTVLLFAFGIGIASSLAFGLVPALRARRSDLHGVLQEGGRRTSGTTRDRIRAALVVAEVALALTLLIGAGLLIRSARYLQGLDLGFNPTSVLSARLSLPEAKYAAPAQAQTAFENVVRALEESPGVTVAAVSSQAPLGPGGNSNGLLAEGKPIAAEYAVDARLRVVTPQFREAMGIALTAGRDFTADDRTGTVPVALVSRELAQRMWPNEDPVGKRFQCCDGPETNLRWKTVVGVVGDVRSAGPTIDIRPEFYLPVAQAPADSWTWIQRTMTVVARGQGSSAAGLAAAIRAAVKTVDPGLAVARLQSLDTDVRASTAPQRFYMMLLIGLGGLGIVLAAVGIYGVIAYLVTLRTHEIGVRLALGATPRNVVRMMTLQGLRPVLIGTVTGLAGAAAGSRLLATTLYGVKPSDPWTYVAAAALVLATAVIATVWPASRATQVSPSRALQD